MYFLVNASPPKRLDVATSHFADALISSKAGICYGVYRLKSSLNCTDSREVIELDSPIYLVDLYVHVNTSLVDAIENL